MVFYAKIAGIALFGLIATHDLCFLSQKKKNYHATIAKRIQAIAKNPSLLIFQSLKNEITLPKLETQGTIPSWLNGTLVRNGPAQFETSTETISHVFDGLAMLHAFSFDNGNISYANKFLKSNYYKTATTTGSIGQGFAQDPCSLIFKRFFSYFSPQSTKKTFDNANVNVAKIAEHFVALTETPLPIEFDVKTLDTIGKITFDDTIKGQVTTAHPHIDFEKEETFNYLTHFGKESTYNIYSMPLNSKNRTLIASIPVEKPSYMHSFGLTKNYIILTEIPFKINPITLLLTNKPFIKNFVWKPKDGTIFTVINRHNGTIVGRFKGEPFFTFHHVNAFEDNNNIIIDLIAYDDASIIDTLSFEHIFNQTNTSSINKSVLKRFTINPNQKSIVSTIISSTHIEMPQINYTHYNMKPYHYVYALTSINDHKSDLIKIDVTNGKSIKWKEKNCSASEPIFVAHPQATTEDDGVIISVILNFHEQRSFLLILDAKTFTEIGRATVPHHIPFNLHGAFFKK